VERLRQAGEREMRDFTDGCIACPHCGEFQYEINLIVNYEPDVFNVADCENCQKPIMFKWEIISKEGEWQFTVREKS
jgi:hypothetical protein